VRVVLFVLLFANLVFFAWSAWIDTPAPAAASPAAKGLPPLVLAAEADAKEASRHGAGGSGAQSAHPANCVSVGPFDSEERANGALAALRERGYEPRQRSEEGERWDGYWVYVANLKSDLDAARVMRTLIQAQLVDAKIMPVSEEEGRRISVGVFSDRIRAERRERLVQRLGVEAELGDRRVPGTVFWMDMDLKPADPAVATDGLLPPDTGGSTLQVRACAAPG
jgi:hypothetical protein